MARFLNPYTDFGFKKLFGEEASKDLLVDFLNQLLPEYHRIEELTFANTENLPDLVGERRAIFDIHCRGANGERFIVEMQKAKIRFFKDRSLFYATFPIRDQAEKGDWDFRLTHIYFVAILDFEYDEDEEKRKFFRDVRLRDQDGDEFYDKLQFKFLQMPLFSKTETELETRFDKWLYFLKNLESLDHIPQILNEEVFRHGFQIAELGHLTSEQRTQYEMSLVAYRDIKNVVDTAKEEGRQEALDITAKKMKIKGLSDEFIAEVTGMTIEKIRSITR